MPRKPKSYNIKSRITSAIRRTWLWSPVRRKVLKDAKDNGNKCAICKEPKEKLEVDHVIPCVPLKEVGERDWNLYINTMFYGEQIAICHDCHFSKTTIQAQIRKEHKKKLKKNK